MVPERLSRVGSGSDLLWLGDKCPKNGREKKGAPGPRRGIPVAPPKPHFGGIWGLWGGLGSPAASRGLKSRGIFLLFWGVLFIEEGVAVPKGVGRGN